MVVLLISVSMCSLLIHKNTVYFIYLIPVLLTYSVILFSDIQYSDSVKIEAIFVCLSYILQPCWTHVLVLGEIFSL